MFYYPNVLQRHTGCFSTVWLAATKGTKIAKREYLKVNVINICKKIIQYILQQVPPPYHGSPIPRLSLYLSAQLSYGTVCVYHRQCDLLIEEMKITLDRLHKAETQLKIDLLQSDLSMLLPDSLMLMQMSENAPDPFFGIMDVPPELPDPMGIPQIRMLLETSGPDIVRFEETPPKRRRRSPREESDHLASPEAITMREEEPILLPSAEIGPDIPELSEFDLDFLVSDLPAFPEAETLPASPKREVPRERKERPKRPKKERPMEPREGEHLAEEEEVRKVDEERILELEKEGEEESRSEIEKKRTELQQLERDIKRIREEQRLLELQRKSEREQERREREEREGQLLQKIQREAEAVEKAKKELERLQRTEAAGELLLEKEREIKRLKELQKERELQLKAENVRQIQLEAERESERLQERQREREQLQEAKGTIEQLRRSLAEKEEEWKRTEESRRISEISEPDISSISEAYKPSPVVSEHDIPMQPDEALPAEGAPETPTPQLISPQPPFPQLVLPELPLVSDDRPVRRRGRRIKRLIDQEIQIKSSLLRKQISDPHISTQPMHPVTLPHMRPRTPASLLDSPTYEHFMAPELKELWSRCAVLEPMQYMREREEDTMSEVVRAVSESGVSIILSSELSLEVSEEERSKPMVFTPVEGRSIQEETFLPIVTEMPELSMEMPETQDILVEDVQRNIYSQIDSKGQSAFLSLIPHSFSHLLVSRFFFSCLVLHTEDIIHMAQVEPYGEIVITPGAQYAEKEKISSHG